MRDKLGKPLTTEGEVRPTNIVPVIAPSPSGTRKVFPMLWGFTAKGVDRPIVNCRVESAAEKTLWKEAWKSHRCIVPASYYFEWEHWIAASRKPKTDDKYMIRQEALKYATLLDCIDLRSSGMRNTRCLRFSQDAEPRTFSAPWWDACCITSRADRFLDTTEC